MTDDELIEVAEKIYIKYRYTTDWVSFYRGFLEGMKLLNEVTHGQDTGKERIRKRNA